MFWEEEEEVGGGDGGGGVWGFGETTGQPEEWQASNSSTTRPWVTDLKGKA